jgi:hypothetical protein
MLNTIEGVESSLLLSPVDQCTPEGSSVLPNLDVQLIGFDRPVLANYESSSRFLSVIEQLTPSATNSQTPDTVSITESPTLPPYPIPPIPEDILPHTGLHLQTSILSLSDTMYPSEVCRCTRCEPSFCDVTPDVTSPKAILKALEEFRWPKKELLRQAHQRWISEQRPSFQSVQLSHGPGNGLKFPTWCLHMWELVAENWDDIIRWRKTVSTLREEEDHTTLRILRTIQWPIRSPVRGISAVEISSFATKEWLSDSHIDLLGGLLNQDLQGKTQRFLDWPIVSQIQKRYSDVKRCIVPSSSKALRKVARQLETRKLTAIGCCFNVDVNTGIPQKDDSGNHWVAVVIDIPTHSLYYGDSLNRPPNPCVIEHMNIWLFPSFRASFTVRLLEHNAQPGDWMCGDYAINMIGHHFLSERYPLVGPMLVDAIAHRRLKFQQLLLSCGTC